MAMVKGKSKLANRPGRDRDFRGFAENEVVSFESLLLRVLENVREADRNPEKQNG